MAIATETHQSPRAIERDNKQSKLSAVTLEQKSLTGTPIYLMEKRQNGELSLPVDFTYTQKEVIVVAAAALALRSGTVRREHNDIITVGKQALITDEVTQLTLNVPLNRVQQSLDQYGKISGKDIVAVSFEEALAAADTPFTVGTLINDAMKRSKKDGSVNFTREVVASALENREKIRGEITHLAFETLFLHQAVQQTDIHDIPTSGYQILLSKLNDAGINIPVDENFATITLNDIQSGKQDWYIGLRDAQEIALSERAHIAAAIKIDWDARQAILDTVIKLHYKGKRPLSLMPEVLMEKLSNTLQKTRDARELHVAASPYLRAIDALVKADEQRDDNVQGFAFIDKFRYAPGHTYSDALHIDQYGREWNDAVSKLDDVGHILVLSEWVTPRLITTQTEGQHLREEDLLTVRGIEAQIENRTLHIDKIQGGTVFIKRGQDLKVVDTSTLANVGKHKTTTQSLESGNVDSLVIAMTSVASDNGSHDRYSIVLEEGDIILLASNMPTSVDSAYVKDILSLYPDAISFSSLKGIFEELAFKQYAGNEVESRHNAGVLLEIK